MSHDALRTIVPIAGWPEERARAVAITGDGDPILPTPFRIGETSAAALAAVGLAVSDLWSVRTGRHEEVAVDARQATASLRSGHYMKLDGAPVSTERNTVMGVYPAKNGRWSYLHCNFPNHRAAALSVLGVPEDREAVSQAVAKWDALELEEALVAARGAGGMVRTMAEWAQHPQAAAVASLPLMEIVKIGESPPEKLPDGDRPLSGIRVLDLTRVLAGPTCARTLAEHGADVLKISAAHLPNLGYQEYDTGHGKLSAHLDLREPEDVETLRGLVRDADVFSQGYRPGGRGAGSAVLSGVGDRLPDRLSDGFRRHGRTRAPRARGRKLAGADLARADRPLARRMGRGAEGRPQGRAEGIHVSRAGALIGDDGHAGRSAASSRTGGAPFGNAAALGPALGATRLPRAGVAGASRVARLRPGPAITSKHLRGGRLQDLGVECVWAVARRRSAWAFRLIRIYCGNVSGEHQGREVVDRHGRARASVAVPAAPPCTVRAVAPVPRRVLDLGLPE